MPEQETQAKLEGAPRHSVGRLVSVRKLVALSGGKDSTAMALRLAEAEPGEYEYLITPTGRELPEMHAHWERLERLLGAKLIRVPGPTLVERIVAYKTLPNFRLRYCTREVKIEPFMKYAAEAAPAVCFVGIRADEASEREGTNWKGIEGVRQDLPLVRWGWGVSQVKQYLNERGVTIPARTDCDLCYHQRIGEWWRLWRDHEERWQEIEALETWTGHTLRSAERDSWPASLIELRKRFEAGYVPNGAAQTDMQIEVNERPTMCAWCAR